MAEQQLVREFNEFEEDSTFISKKMDEFNQIYRGKFVAVKDQRVIASGENFEQLMLEIRNLGFDPSQVIVEYIPVKGEIILY